MTKVSSSFFATASPRVFAHRGLAVAVSENSTESFALALRAGATHLETDTRITADGVAVLFHDAHYRRGGRRVRLSERTLAELRDPVTGAGFEIPTLEGVLREFPAARFNIDVKENAVIAPAAAAIRGAGAGDRVLITSFNDHRARAARALLPGVASSASQSGVIRLILGLALHLPRLARSGLRGVQAVQLPVKFAGIRVLTPRLIELCHAHGVEVHIWTVNDPSEMARLLAMGVDGLITDRADLAAGIVRQRGKKSSN